MGEQSRCGAGVSGLTTAICLAEAGRRVRVWTAEPPQRTTSVVAGALWGPSFQEPMAKTMAWTEVSLQEFTALAADPDSRVRLAPAVVVGALPADGELPPQAQMIPELRPCTDEELPPGFESGVSLPDAAHGHAALPRLLGATARCGRR